MITSVSLVSINHLTQITSVGEDVEEKKPLSTVGGNVNW